MTIRELEQVTITALKAGSAVAFSLCYDLYFKALCSFANSYVRQPAVAEEIIQNVFLEVWISREKLSSNISIKAYLLTMVRHDCLDHLKHQRLESRYAGEYLQDHSEGFEDVFDALVNKELEQTLQTAISKLPAHCKEVFLLSRFEYLSYKGIAERLSISVKTVENQISKALRIIREELDPFL
jgi:RNA polymerase sigma-70 factor, ECF subfamily